VSKNKEQIDKKAHVLQIIKLLKKEQADAKIALEYASPLELLVATILSAQCTDKVVNIVTMELFKKFRTPQDYANADIKEIEEDIKSTGFYRNKAKNIKKCAQLLIAKFNSQVPKTMEELLECPGVARKTANIVLSNAYGVVEGIAVDTHVRRLAGRLGLTSNKDPNKIEKDLMIITPIADWMKITDLLIFHGRRVCQAKKPKCQICMLNKICPSAFTF